MAQTGDIIDAIARELASSFLNRPVYVNFCPDEFERPSFLIEFISSTQNAASYCTNRINMYFTITCYEEMDKYSVSSQEDLVRIQDEVAAAFSGGVLQVGDRYLELRSSAGGCDAACSFVDLQFDYFDDKQRRERLEETMETVHMAVEERSLYGITEY